MKFVTAVLIAFCAVGIIGIPLGDPKFFIVAIVLEASFIALTVLSLKRIRSVVIPNIAIACTVSVGNTLSPTHTDVMLTLSPIYNALILIIGGYLLQALLIITSIQANKVVKHIVKDKVDHID
ncbi:MAG: hypothetical protein ACE5KA_03760 [Nitrososphaerales archaeon]